jgi:hypothetical protein
LRTVERLLRPLGLKLAIVKRSVSAETRMGDSAKAFADRG